MIPRKESTLLHDTHRDLLSQPSTLAKLLPVAIIAMKAIATATGMTMKGKRTEAISRANQQLIHKAWPGNGRADAGKSKLYKPAVVRCLYVFHAQVNLRI